MRVLLDTHCWLWMQATPERFSARVRKLLQDPANVLLLSAASAWEIGIKHALGKLRLPLPASQYVPTRMKSGQVEALPIAFAHALRAGELPRHHADPFDRLLIAQAQLDELTLLTVDRAIEPYELRILWGD